MHHTNDSEGVGRSARGGGSPLLASALRKPDLAQRVLAALRESGPSQTVLDIHRIKQINSKIVFRKNTITILK